MKVLEIFKIFDQHEIKYFLLRPVRLNYEIIDIDLIIKKKDFNSAVNCLLRGKFNVKIKKSIANHAVYIKVDDLILDVKFKLGF